MRLRTNIFIWVFFATVLPLTVLALAATYYSENDYQRTVQQEINTGLNTVATDLNRHLSTQRELALGLARANAVQEFLPELASLYIGEGAPRFNIHRSRINHYFEGFQTIIPDMFIMRLMDRNGNTLIKVTKNKRSLADYESISGIAYVEHELASSAFYEKLKQMPRDDVTMLALEHNRRQTGDSETLAIMDFVVPLYYEDSLVGALSLTLFGEEIDRLLKHAPRLYKSKIFIAENNPENSLRHNMLLFDDENKLQFALPRTEIEYLTDYYGEDLLTKVIDQPFGFVETEGGKQRIFYSEIFPYPNQLVSWIIATQVESENIAAPFKQIRLVIWLSAGIALVISLLLANFGVRNLSIPMKKLSNKLIAYAKAEHAERVSTDQKITEIRDLAQAFNTMADNLDKAQHMMLQSAKLASIGQMAAGIGHEINNPLNNILSYAKLIDRSITESDSELKKDLQSLREEATRASNIVNGILNFARQVPPHYAPFQVLPWLQDTMALVRQSAKTAGITLAYECVDDITIEGDRNQLQQAMINLLINAIQATPSGKQVLARVSHDEDYLMIQVIDQGKGIKDEDIDNVFDPFFTTKEEGEGSGLGLSISLGIIERHNGSLSLMNNLDIGVTATMVLPINRVSSD